MQKAPDEDELHLTPMVTLPKACTDIQVLPQLAVYSHSTLQDTFLHTSMSHHCQSCMF